MNILRWISCKILGNHVWTSKAMEDKPAPKILDREGFKDYAKLYCKHCKYESKLNSRL